MYWNKAGKSTIYTVMMIILVQTGGGRQQELGEGVKPAYVGHLVGEHEGQPGHVAPVQRFGQEDDGAEQTVSEGAVHPVGAAHPYPPADGMAGQPGGDKGVLHRQRGIPLPAAPQVGEQEAQGTPAGAAE